jgi:hypothetical protein
MKPRKCFLIAVFTWFSHCDDPSGIGREPDEYVGCATDENWATFDEREPFATVSPIKAPVFTAPPAGAVIAFSNRPVFTWNVSMAEAGAPDGNVPHEPACVNCCEQFNRGGLSTLHEPPVTGDIYDLQFMIADKVIHRALTTLQEWAPPPAVWTSWRGMGVTLTIWRMSLVENEPVAGPFTSGVPFLFSVIND